MTRVLIVGRGAPERGGIRTFMEAILASDLNDRHDLSYLNLGRERGTIGGRASLENLTRTLHDLRSVWREAAGMDVVHVHSAFAPTVTALRAGMLCLAARLRGARPILHVHGGRFPVWVERSRHRLLVRAMTPAVCRFAVVSERSAEALAAVVGSGGVRFVPNGVDTARFRAFPRSGGRLIVLYVGILSPRKGLLDLFEASRRLRGEGRDHELWVVGGVPDEGTEASDAVTAAAPAWVRFLGEVAYDALPEVYRDAAIFCLPSWWEAAPLTVMEAASAGLPVVATRVGDLPSMVDDGATGFLVPPQDPDALATSIAKLVDDPELRRAMGARAAEIAERRFDLTAALGAIDDMYGDPG
jgi:glycosyltransferase involved in cell wall biosynthesis